METWWTAYAHFKGCQAALLGESGPEKSPRRISKNSVPFGRRVVKFEIGPRRPPQASQMTNLPFIAAIFPSPSHLAQTSAASAFRTIRPCESWYCISNSRKPSHSSRVSACPIVPDISLVSSSSNSTTNFHLVRRASWVMPTYCMFQHSKTQDIVSKNNGRVTRTRALTRLERPSCGLTLK